MVYGNTSFSSATLSQGRKAGNGGDLLKPRPCLFLQGRQDVLLELEKLSIWKKVSLDSRNRPTQSLNSEFLYSNPFEDPT